MNIAEELRLEYSSSVTVNAGETAVISVRAVTPDQETPVSYQWSYYDEDEGEYAELSGETASLLNLPARPYSWYRCKVWQGDEEEAVSADISVNIDSGDRKSVV